MSPLEQSPIMPPHTSSGPLRILVAEDHMVNQRLVMAFLEEAGYTAVLASSGREALALVEQETFSLVLMDVQMPEMDGLEATAAIRARERSTGSRVPILAMTAHAHQEDRDRCLAAGMDGHLAKPIRYEELVQQIERWALREPVPEPEAPPRAGSTSRPGLRPELAGLFVADALRLHAEMQAAVAGRDGASLARAAHTLSGSAGLFLAHAVFELTQRLERLGKAGDFGPDAERACRELAEALAHLAPPPAQ
jgi:two-component system, sensor histidine kinase and response regulator